MNQRFATILRAGCLLPLIALASVPVSVLAQDEATKAAAKAPETATATSAPGITPEREAATRLQVFLDRANFGPGKIDGRYGGFTEKALTLYRQSRQAGGSSEGAPPAGASAPKAAPEAPNDSPPSSASNQDTSATEAPAADRNTRKSKGPIDSDETNDSKDSKDSDSKAKDSKDVPFPDLSDLDLSTVDPVFIEYKVTEADVKTVGDVPKERR